MIIKQEVKWGLGAVLLTAVALALLAYTLGQARAITGGVLGAPLDDAWIHFQFARNLSQGHGFSYNPGEPTPGSTAPLWTLLLAPIGLFSDSFMAPALALSALFLLAAVWAAYGFAAWASGRWWPGLLAGLGTAVAGRFLWAGLAGMETTAFAALSLIAIWAYSKYGLSWWVALLFGLAAQLRPEGHALFALAMLDAAFAWAKAQQHAKRWAWRTAVPTFALPLLIYALVALPYALFSLSTTGRPLPNTFYAKAGSEQIFSWRTLRETIAYMWQDNPASFLFAAIGLGPMWRRSRLAVYWLLGLPFLTAVIIDFTWHHGRYTMPLIPLQMVVGAVGVYWLVNRLPLRGRRTAVRTAVVLLGLVFLLPGLRAVPGWAEMLGTNTREVQEIDVALGYWLAANTPPDALVAVDDIGAIAFLSGRRIVDMNGLVSPEVWPALAEPEGLARNQALTRILSQSAPAYMAAFPLWRWDIATNPAVAVPLYHVRTETQTIIFQQDAYVYDMTWPYVSEAAPSVPQAAVFDEAIRLFGYDIGESNDFLPLTLYWQSLAPVAASYDVFVHLVDGRGRLVTQIDQKPLQGLAATDVWQPGDILRDPLHLPLPPDLPSGGYTLRLGLYDRATGARLPIAGAPAENNALILDSITLP